MENLTQKETNGLYELSDSARASLVGNPYYNDDIAPTRVADRTWGTRDVTSLWVTLCICIPAFTMAAGLVGFGLSPWLAVLNVTLGNLLVLIPIQLNSSAGTKYGIPFPLFSRMTFGARGAHIPSISRAIAACGWNAVQCWIGGAALVAMISALVPGFGAMGFPAFLIGFFLFIILCMWATIYGSEGIRKLQKFAAPTLAILTVGVLVWSTVIATGANFSVGDILQASNNSAAIAANGGMVLVFLGGLTANIGFWATLAINIPDFSRYANSQKAQFRGQLYGMPLTMFICAFVGAYMAQATNLVFGEAFFDPSVILQHLGNPVLTFVVAAAVAFATMTTNIMANIVAPANGFSNLAPRKISYKTGVLITGLLAVLFQPWYLLGDAAALFFSFIGVYGGVIAPLAAIFIADYYLVKQQRVDVLGLFKGSEGRYWYAGGFNSKAVIAWIAGFILPTIGNIMANFNPGHTNVLFRWITANGYILGFVIALVVYVAIMPKTDPSFVSEEESASMTEK